MNKKTEYVFCNAARDLRKQCRVAIRNAVKRMRQTGYVALNPGDDYLAGVDGLAQYFEGEIVRVFKAYRNKRHNYEPLFSMPPARRKPPAKGAKPLTLVERRAIAARAKVVEWTRKQKLAATKAKLYRKKVSYYTKKGVI